MRSKDRAGSQVDLLKVSARNFDAESHLYRKKQSYPSFLGSQGIKYLGTSILTIADYDPLCHSLQLDGLICVTEFSTSKINDKKALIFISKLYRTFMFVFKKDGAVP